jgi:hypothetical protein
MDTKDIYLSFIIGASILSTIVSFSYIGYAYSKKRLNFPYELIPIFISIMFGIFNIINVYTRKKYDNKLTTFLVGGIMGLLFSIVGRFGYDLPIRMFNFTRGNEYMVHIYAFLLYGTIFSLIVQPIDEYFL